MYDPTAAALAIVASSKAAYLASQPESLKQAREEVADALRVYQATYNPNDLREYQRKKAAYEAEKARAGRPALGAYRVVGEAFLVQPLAA